MFREAKKFVRNCLLRVQGKCLSLGNQRECPMCGWTGSRFMTHGAPQKRRYDARCPRCDSLERQRLAYLTVTDFAKERMPTGKWRTLHVAPMLEPWVENWLRSLSSDYLSIDLAGPAMQQMDLTKLELDDRTYDFLWCSHVLEHIPADRDAMREMYRVLDKGGVALVQIPIWCEKTYEDWSTTSEAERLEKFYQRDHVRLYGTDVEDRLTDSGFDVTKVHARDFGPVRNTRHSLNYLSTNEVYLCRKVD